MAIIGFICLILIAAFLLYAGLRGLYASAIYWQLVPLWQPVASSLVLTIIGSVILYLACHYAPFHVAFTS